jgi:hypothetical protein
MVAILRSQATKLTPGCISKYSISPVIVRPPAPGLDDCKYQASSRVCVCLRRICPGACTPENDPKNSTSIDDLLSVPLPHAAEVGCHLESSLNLFCTNLTRCYARYNLKKIWISLDPVQRKQGLRYTLPSLYACPPIPMASI